MKKYKIKSFLVLTLLFVCLLSIFILAEQFTQTPTSFNISISSSSWKAIKISGIETKLNLIVSDVKDKKADFCWYFKDGITPNANDTADKALYYANGTCIKDDKNKCIVGIKYESSKCNVNGTMKNGFHLSLTDAQAVNINDNFKLGNTSWVESYQNESKVVYDTGRFSCNVTLRRSNGASYEIAPDSIWIKILGNKYKLGANDTFPKQDTAYQYEWLCTQPITYEDGKYLLEPSQTFSSFFFKSKTYPSIIDTSDVCTPQANCTFNLSTDNKTLKLNFIGFYNVTSNMIFIDPAFTQIYNSSTDLFFANQTQASVLGVALQINSSAVYPSGFYNVTSGDFKSFVFYNSSSSYWNTTLSIASNPAGSIADVNGINVSYPGLVGYWDLDNKTRWIGQIIDDQDTGFSNSSGWTYQADNFGAYDTDEVYDDAGSGTEWAAWSFTVPTTGQYYVYTHWTPFSNRASNAGYNISSDNGITNVIVNQETNVPNWYSLGLYNFTAGTNYNVTLTDKANEYVIADAIYVTTSANVNNMPHREYYVSGTSHGMNSTVGISSGALSTNMAQWAEVGQLSDLRGSKYLSASAWIKAGSYTLSDTFGTVIGKYNSVANPGYTYQFLFGTAIGGKPAMLIYNDAGGYVQEYATNAIALNQWYHVVGVWNNNVSNNFTIYVNGVSVNTTKTSTAVVTALTYQNTSTMIGRVVSGTTPFYFNGSIDEVALYNNTLSQAEVTALYKSGLSQHANTNVTLQYRTSSSYNISDSGLVSLWGLNNGIGENATYFKGELGINNGTCVNVTLCPTLNPNGTVGGAMLFDGTNDYINFSNSVNLSKSACTGTLSLWVNPKSFSNGKYLVSSSQVEGNMINFATDTPTGNLYIQFYSGVINDVILSDGAPTLNLWNHVVYASNGSKYSMWVNGVSRTISVYAGSNSGRWFCNLSAGNHYTYIGYPTAAGIGYYSGSIDEVRLYNRSLSAAEIQDLYNLGSYHINWNNWSAEQVVQDGVGLVSSQSNFMQFKSNLYSNTTSTSPYVFNYSVVMQSTGVASSSITANLTNPANNTITNLPNQNFTVNVTSTLPLANATLNIYFINGTLYNSTFVTSIVGLTQTTLGIVVTLIDGIYNWFYSLFDNTGFGVTTQNNTLTVGINYPQFSNFNSNNGTLYGSGIATFNVTVLNTNGTVWLQINNTNLSANNLGSNIYNVSIYLTSGTYAYTWYAYGDGVTHLLNSSNGKSYTIGAPFSLISSNAENSFAISQFIKVNGTNFTIGTGGLPYTFTGANSYYLTDYATNQTYDDAGNQINNSIQYVDEILDKAQSLNINVMRTWAMMAGGNTSVNATTWFEGPIGGHYNLFLNGNTSNYNETMFKALDYVLYQASRRDIRLQLVLVNNWDTYGGMSWWVQQTPSSNKTGQGSNCYYDGVNWVNCPTNTFHDQFYTNPETIQLFQGYVAYVLNRTNTYSGLQYKNDPAIFSWLLANEPRAKGDGTSANSPSNLAKIVNWTLNMTTFIKSIDSNHIIGLGVEGLDYNSTWGEGTAFILNHNNTGVDFVSYELNPYQWNYVAAASENATNNAWQNAGAWSNATINWWTLTNNNTWGYQWSSTNYWNPKLARHAYDNWVLQHNKWANQLNMPVVMEEVEVSTSISHTQQDKFLTQAITTFFNNSGDGMMFWNFNHDQYWYSTAGTSCHRNDTNITGAGCMDDGFSFYYSTDPFLMNKSSSLISAYNYVTSNNTEGTSFVTLLNNNFYTFYYNVSLNGDTINNCSLWMNNTNKSLQSTNYYQDQINTTITDGINTFTKQLPLSNMFSYWYIRCCSSASCSNLAENYISTPPIITLTSPAQNAILNNTFVNLNYTVADGIVVTSCSLFLNGNLNQTNNNLTLGTLLYEHFNVTVSSIPNSYNWQVRCTDMGQQTRYSIQGNFIYDDGTMNVTLLSPANNIFVSNATQNYTVYINSSAPISYIRWYLDGVLDSIYTMVGTINTIIYGSIHTISEGFHTWFYEVTDYYGLNKTSETWNITLDSTYPIFSNYNDSNATYDFQTATFNVTITKTNGTAGLQFNGVNYTVQNISYIYNSSISGLSAGTYNYYWWAYGNGSTNLFNTSQIRTYTVLDDITPPNLQIIYPANETYSNNININVNYIVSDLFLQSCWWTNNSGQTNNFINCGTNIIGQTWNEGSNLVIIYANDSSNNVNSSSVTFYIDLINPNATILNPLNGTLTNTNQNFTVNLTDNLALGNAILEIYNSTSLVNQTTVTITGVQQTLGIVVDLVDGLYHWLYSIFDKAGNNFITSNNTLEIDKTAPVITINQLTPNPAQLGADDITFVWNATDLHLDTYYFNVTDSLGNSIISLNTSKNVTLNHTLFSQGTYTFIVWANDSAGNTATSPSYLAVLNVLDSQAPDLIVTVPTNNSVYSGTSVNVNLTFVAYDLSNLSSAWWSQDGITNRTINITNNVTYSSNLWWEQVADTTITYPFKVCVNDTYNNINCSVITIVSQIGHTVGPGPGGTGGGGGNLGNLIGNGTIDYQNVTRPLEPKTPVFLTGFLGSLYSIYDWASYQLSPNNHMLGVFFFWLIVGIILLSIIAYYYYSKKYDIKINLLGG